MYKIFTVILSTLALTGLLVACDKNPAAVVSPTPTSQTSAVPAEIKPTEIAPAEIAPTEAAPAEIVPAEIVPTEITPAPEAQDNEATPADVAPAAPISKNTLLFFMNPGGVPCQIQEQILAQLGSQLTDQANIIQIRTDVMADRNTFGQYGIRALPALVLLDGAQKEVLRLPPGIQQGEYLLEALATLHLAAK